MPATLRGPLGLIHLDQDILTIGRSRQNRLVFTHPQLSGRHAEVCPLGEGRYQLIDVGSTNGTSVNGQRLIAGTPALLSDGDTVLLGGAGGIELVFASRAVAAQDALRLPAPPVKAPDAVLQAHPSPAPGAWPASPDGIPSDQPPGGPMFPTVRPEPGLSPVPAPLPAAITPVARAKRPTGLLPVGGSLLVLLLLIAGIGLGAGVLGRPFAHPGLPVTVNTPRPTAAPAIVQTGSVTLQGQATTVLTTTEGQTLYYFTPDTATATVCTGACIANWPPLLFRRAGTPTAATALPGTLSLRTSANGPQVAYNGHPLYTFSGDTAPGQANGQGKAGKWFVATPALTLNGNTPPLILTATVTLGGTPTTILTTAAGLTLYYFTPDTATTTACTGACATAWPPLLFSGSGTPPASPALPGTLSVQQTPNGAQVEYNGQSFPESAA